MLGEYLVRTLDKVEVGRVEDHKRPILTAHDKFLAVGVDAKARWRALLENLVAKPSLRLVVDHAQHTTVG
jgi:hypothetical protein